MVGKKVTGLDTSIKDRVDKINRGFRIRNRVYITVTFITILMLVPYIPFWFNIDNAMKSFGIGRYHTEKEYLNNYGNGSVGIFIQLDLDLTEFTDIDIISGEKYTHSGYEVTSTFSMIASENIEPLGFIYRVLLHYRDEKAIEHDAGFLNPPRELLQFNTGYIINKESICNSTGIVTYLFQIGSNVYNETTEYQITYVIPYGNLDYANFKLVFYTILGVYLLSIGLVPFFFKKLIKPTFGFVIEEEDLERDKKFREFVNKKKIRLRVKN